MCYIATTRLVAHKGSKRIFLVVTLVPKSTIRSFSILQNFGVLITNTSALPAGVLLMKDSTLSILVFFLFLASWPRKMSIMARRSRLESRKHLRELRVAPKRKNLKSPGRGVKRFYCRWPRSKLPERAQLVHDHSSASRPRLPHFSSKCDERRKIRCNKASPPRNFRYNRQANFHESFH